MKEEQNAEMEGKEEKKKKKKRNGNEGKEKIERQSKFFVDLRYEKEELGKIKEILKEVNSKDYGRNIFFKDLAIYAIKKLGAKDLEKLKEQSLTEMEKIQRLLDDHNKKMGTTLELGEFLIRKLNIE